MRCFSLIIITYALTRLVGWYLWFDRFGRLSVQKFSD